MKRTLITILVLTFLAAPLSAVQASYWDNYYRSGPAQGPTEITMVAGETRDVVLRFANKGWYLWRGGGKGWRYASLYSTRPYARHSDFFHPSWKSRIQPAALWEYRVWPGETGSFRFTLQAPETPGEYVENFQMAIEDTAWVYGGGVEFRINVVPAGSGSAVSEPQIDADAYIVIDTVTGEVLKEKNADQVRSVASITKLMTALVALEDVRVNQSQAVTLASSDEVGGARLRVSVGTTWPVGSMLASTLIGSTNNTANALARSTGISKESFIQKMNQRAQNMGLWSTSFADPTGIEVENVSTAREVAKLASAAFSHPMIRFLASRPTYTVITSDQTGYRTISNTNKLVGDPAIQVVAGKTGYLIEAGWTLATQVRRSGESDLMVVVLGCGDRWQSFSDVKNLANWAWNQY